MGAGGVGVDGVGLGVGGGEGDVQSASVTGTQLAAEVEYFVQISFAPAGQGHAKRFVPLPRKSAQFVMVANGSAGSGEDPSAPGAPDRWLSDRSK